MAEAVIGFSCRHQAAQYPHHPSFSANGAGRGEHAWARIVSAHGGDAVIELPVGSVVRDKRLANFSRPH
jgi:hypothetical protein